jgi:hypothetical protein
VSSAARLRRFELPPYAVSSAEPGGMSAIVPAFTQIGYAARTFGSKRLSGSSVGCGALY